MTKLLLGVGDGGAVVLVNDTFHLTVLPILALVGTGLIVLAEPWSVIAGAVVWLAVAGLTLDFFRRPRSRKRSAEPEE